MRIQVNFKTLNHYKINIRNLESKIVEAEVSVIDDCRVESVRMFHYNTIMEIRYHWSGFFGFLVLHVVQIINHL